MAVQYSQAYRGIKAQAAQAKFSGAKPSMFLYLGVGMLALLKDLLDFVGIGSFPGIGTVVTLCVTFLIWMLLTLFDRSGAKSNKQLARGIVIILIGLIEAIGFGLNFLPIETFMVVALYIMAKSAWRKEEKIRLGEQKKAQAADRVALIQEATRAHMEGEQAQAVLAQQERAANDERYNQEQAANDEQYRQAQPRVV